MAARACQPTCCASQRAITAPRHAAQLAAAPPPPPLRSAAAAGRLRRSVAAAAADNSDAEVAVFRFTLGSDAADAAVPRVVGGVGAALLLLNHLLGDQPSEAQLRAEALGAALAAVAFVTPTIEQRLKEIQPGRGRQAAAASVPGAGSVFALQPGLPDGLKQELAWASYALLLNTNICGLAVYWDGRAVLARGQLGTAALGSAAAGGSKADPGAVLDALSVAEPAAASRGWRQGPLYCPDKAAIAKAGAGGWPCVPAGAESLLVQPLLPFSSSARSSSSATGGASPQGFMLLVSERPRALSGKERAWAAAVAAKLHDALQ
ncbi:required for cyt b6 assembly [Chlorella sorokiniana]|uniref:Required for cyt b6 assembly n=1 Tax=Chlorella sorokiniana TaxID=3076 RepID=A0A2P6U4P6_CHLSO|nr:required for cyt b6 assembly [Chlorella sorokiniana]|eukprot:PRW61279.1 required for cyt b6 assembly [Chlorella sorokiniana]